MIFYEDMVIYWQEGTLPPVRGDELLKAFSNTRVSTVFITEDDMHTPTVVEEKVLSFVQDYGMQPDKIKVVVMVALNPTDSWGKGFPYKVRISVFPKRLYKLYTSKQSGC